MSDAYSFEDQLDFSHGEQEQIDILTLQKIIPGCKCVYRAKLEDDKNGVDYIAILRRNAKIFIDVKTRTKGCSRFWQGEPEIALEKWSIRPGGKFAKPREQAQAGWTLSESKKTDFIFFKFDPDDTHECFLIPFQLLRVAFLLHLAQWYATYKIDIQESYNEYGSHWESECIFVPISIVLRAIEGVSRQTLVFN